MNCETMELKPKLQASRIPHFPVFSRKSSRPPRAAPERRRRKLTALFAVCMGIVVLMTGSRWSTVVGASELFFILGICLACLGALGRIWSSLYISGHKTSNLIKVGPYSLCRNPLYFFSALGMVGIGLTTATFSVPSLMMLFFTAYYPMIIRHEEHRLDSVHGPEFLDYWRRTSAFWPRTRYFEEPETYSIFPRIIRRNLLDAFWFIAIAAVIHAETQCESLYPSFIILRLW